MLLLVSTWHNDSASPREDKKTRITIELSYLFAVLGKLRAQATTCGSLSYTTFPTNKNPLQGFLLNDIFEWGIGEILVIIVVICHCVYWGLLPLLLQVEVEVLWAVIFVRSG